MKRTTATLAVSGLAIGVLGAGAAWALLDDGSSQAVAPISDPTASGPSPTSDPSSTSVGSSIDDSTPPTGSTTRSTTDRSASAVVVPEGITIDAARQIALRVKPGTVREVELEDEHNRAVWKVDINGSDGARWEVYVDAITGTVLRTELH
jgi:hypothetical protein